jgi:hypothetical protein
MRINLAKRLQGKTAKSFSNSGFTLMELMVAATLTTAVISAAGYGVASMISTSTASNSRSERRAELSRSNDFIATEIREGSGLVTGGLSSVSPAGFDASYTGKVTGTVTKVLMVKPSTGSTPIVYFVATPTAGSAKGPRALYRWGPAFNNDGTYSSSAPWVSEVLVDQIQPATAPAGVSYTAPSCSTGLNGDFGFATCVDSLGKSAEIFQNGKISKVLGASENYEVKMSAGSRKTTVAIASASFGDGASATALDWTLNNGVVTTNTSLTMNVRYLGGDIVCGNPLHPIPTSGLVTLKEGNASPVTNYLTMTPGVDTTISNVTADTTMTISGKAEGNSGSGSCNGSTYGPYTSNNTTQVRALKNGDNVPSTPGYLGQTSIDAILTSASSNPVTGRPIVNTTTHKIDLAASQVIYLFEFGSTDPNSAAFDLQDMVVLATITPTSRTTSTSTTTSTKCNNGLGNGSDGCTPGNARANDEPVYDSSGTLTCWPSPGNPCTQASKKNGK